MMIFGQSLTAGCSQSPALTEEDRGPYFCDVEELRLFTQEELDARAANWPDNLRKDHKTNTTFERECIKNVS